MEALLSLTSWLAVFDVHLDGKGSNAATNLNSVAIKHGHLGKIIQIRFFPHCNNSF